MTNGETQTRRARLLDEAFDQPVQSSRRQRLLDQVFDPETTEVEQPISHLQFIARMAQGVELEAPDPDRPIIEEAGVGLVRSYAGLIESGGGLSLLAAGQLERVVGDNPLSRLLTNYSELTTTGASLTRARFPRSEEPGFTGRRTVGDVFEALPGLAMQFGTGLAVGPAGGAAMRIGTFAATGAAQVVGQQYLAALSATDDPNVAAAEAFGAGLITLGLNSIPGFAAFRKFPGSQRFFMNAALKIGRRAVLVGPAESLEEMAEAVLIDAYASIIRDDPTLANKIFQGDPEYWSDVLRQGIAGLFAGATMGAVIGGMEATQQERLVREITQVIESRGTLTTTQLTAAERFIRMATEAERERLVAARFRRRVAGEPEPEVTAAEPRAGEEFFGFGQRVRVVSVGESNVTIQTRPGVTTTMDREVFGNRFEPVETRRRVSPEQLNRRAVAQAQREVREEAAKPDPDRETLDQLTVVRRRMEANEITVEEAKAELTRLARNQIDDVPKPLLTTLAQRPTPSVVRRGFRQARQAIARQRRGKAITAAKDAVGKAAKSKGFRTEILRGLRRVARGFKDAGLSKQGQKAMARLLTVLEGAKPETLEAELGRQLEKLADQNRLAIGPVADIREIASAIETQARAAQARRLLSQRQRQARIRELSTRIADEMAGHVRAEQTLRGRILGRQQGPISSLLRITFGLIENMDLDTLAEFLGGEDSTTWRALYRALELGQRDGLAGYFASTDRLRDFLAEIGTAFGSEELTRLSSELVGVSNSIGETLSILGFESTQRLEAETRTITLGLLPTAGAARAEVARDLLVSPTGIPQKFIHFTQKAAIITEKGFRSQHRTGAIFFTIGTDAPVEIPQPGLAGVPVQLRVNNLFDFRNKTQVETLADKLFAGKSAQERLWFGDKETDPSGTFRFSREGFIKEVSKGGWAIIESLRTQRALRELKHDAFSTGEDGQFNVAVFNNEQIINPNTGRPFGPAEIAKVRTAEEPPSETLELFPAEIMGIAAAMSDEETRDMILERGTPVRFSREPTGKSRKLTQVDLDSMIAELGPSERAIVDFMVREINGPVKETMRAWSIQELGFDITKPQTWWTRHRRIEGRVEQPTTLANLRAQFLRSVGMRPGITRARGQDVKSAIEFRDIFIDFNNVVWQTNMVAHLTPAMRDARSILRSQPVREVLDNSRASRAQQAFDQIFEQIAREITGDRTPRGFVESKFQPLIRNLPRGLLGLSPRVAAYQIVSAAMAQSEIPARFLAQALGAATDPAVQERLERDPIMRSRAESSAMGLVNDVSEVGRSLFGFKERGEGPMFLIRMMDRIAIRIVWQAAELQAESEGLTGEALRERTWEIGERAISRTQPMFDSLHIAVRAIEARQRGGLFRLVNFFRAQRNKLTTMVIRSARRIERSPDDRTIQREAINIGMATIANAIAISTIRNVLTVGTIAAIVTGEFGDDQEEEASWSAFWADVTRTLAGIPFMGEVFGEIAVQMTIPEQRAFEPDLVLINDLTGGVVRGTAQAKTGMEDQDTAKFLRGVGRIAAAVLAAKGVPAPFILRIIEDIIELNDKGGRMGSTPP